MVAQGIVNLCFSLEIATGSAITGFARTSKIGPRLRNDNFNL
jgi:hypothetical protein